MIPSRCSLSCRGWILAIPLIMVFVMAPPGMAGETEAFKQCLAEEMLQAEHESGIAALNI